MIYNFQTVKSVYPNWIIRIYVTLRFMIINREIVRTLLHYIPVRGRLLNIGCGFGLFDLTLGLSYPLKKILGIDLNPRRIRIARQAAQELNLTNVNFMVADISKTSLEGPFSGILILDVLHHIDRNAQRRVIAQCANILEAGGVLVIKDIEGRRGFKLFFTWLLDKIMTRNESMYYFTSNSMIALLRQHKFYVIRIRISDLLPYPHVLLVCHKQSAQSCAQAAATDKAKIVIEPRRASVTDLKDGS